MAGLSSIIDYSINGGTDTSGALKELYGKKAFENAILVWLTSMEGDTIREVGRGGYIYPYLMKPLSFETAEEMADTIRDGLVEDFQSAIEIIGVAVNPNPNTRAWEVQITGYSPEYKENVEVSTSLRSG